MRSAGGEREDIRLHATGNPNSHGAGLVWASRLSFKKLSRQGEQERVEAMLRVAVKLDPAWEEAAHNLVYVCTHGRGPGNAD